VVLLGTGLVTAQDSAELTFTQERQLGSGQARVLEASPDHTTLAVGTTIGLKLYDLQTLGLLLDIPTDAAVTEVAWSPDGRQIATLLDQIEAVIWDAVDGEQLATLEALTAPFWRLDWSPTGDHIVGTVSPFTMQSDNRLAIWDTQEHVGRWLPGHERPVNVVTWSADGAQLLSGGQDGRVLLWDVASGAVLQEYPGFEARSGLNANVHWVDWSPDGAHVLALGGGSDGLAIVWDAATGSEIARVQGGVMRPLGRLPDGQLRIAQGAAIWALDPVSGAFEELVAAADCTWAGDVASDGSRAVGHGQRARYGRFCVGDLRTGQVVADLDPQMRMYSGASQEFFWTPNGARLVSWGTDSILRLWDWEAGQELAAIGPFSEPFESVAISPTGQYVAAGNIQNYIWLWDLATGELVHRLDALVGVNDDLSWSSDGTQLVAVSEVGPLKVWDAVSGDILLHLDPDARSQEYDAVAWSPDGTQLVTIQGRKLLTVREADSGEVVREIAVPDDNSVYGVDWSADGMHIAAGGHQTVYVFNSATGAVMQTWVREGSPSVKMVRWSPDGTQLAAAGARSGVDEARVTFYALGQPEPQGEITLPAGSFDPAVTALAWSPDGTHMAAAAYGGSLDDTLVFILDTGSLALGQSLDGHTNSVTGLSWVGDRLASASSDGTVVIWHVE